MRIEYSHLVLFFFVYSFVGWLFESILCSVMERRPVNRGFLHGPICPVYGLGGVAILLLAAPFREQPPVVFVVSLAAVTVIEYFVGWLLETLFSMRWWDYSHCKFNLKGRICLKNSLFFGLLGLGMVYGLHPPVESLVARVPGAYLRVIASTLMVVLSLDLLTTLNNLLGIREKLGKLQFALNELDSLNREHSWYNRNDVRGSLARVRELIVEEPDPEDEEMLEFVAKLEQVVEWTEQLSVRRMGNKGRRLLEAYPSLKAPGLEQAMDRIRESWESWGSRERRRGGLRAGVGSLGHKAANKARQARQAVVERVSFYRLSWIFLIAGVIGYVLETLYCIVLTGGVESRQGLLYGPFNQVYGFGAVLMILLLTPLAQKSDRWLFFGGAIVGGGFEWVCSWLQEAVFGTVSWDYSDHTVSFGGRTSLLYMFFWGILGVFLIKGIYPWLCRVIERIPKRQGARICALLSILIACNMVLSGLAVARWSERARELPAETGVARWLDEHYPDEQMREIYPNMIHKAASESLY